MSNVVQFHPYQILGKIEAQVAALTAYALTGESCNSDVVLCRAARLRELNVELIAALQRSRLEEQLEASIASLKAERPTR